MISGPLVILGDVHGDAERLHQALGTVHDDEVSVVCVGDYVNRGPDSRGVLDLLIDARRRFGDQLILLRGNHEVALLRFLDGGSLADFAAHGGLSTIRSYLPSNSDGAIDVFRSIFPAEHRALLEATKLHYETEDLLVSHVGFDPMRPHDRTSATLSNGHPGMFSYDGPWPRPLTVCGHYVQRSGHPFMTEHLACIDTGCGTLPDGRLTALRLPGRDLLQF